MNDTDNTWVADDAIPRSQHERILEYEKSLEKNQGKPLLAAMFLLYFAISVSLLSLVACWVTR